MKSICWATKEIFDPLMAEWSRHIWDTKISDHWSRLFEYPWILVNGDFKEGQLVLDAGGGDSPLQDLIAMQGCHVLNVDIDPEVLKVLQERGGVGRGSLTFQHADLRKLPHGDGSFDRVVCASVIEHDFGYMEVLEELWRVLKPDGRLLVTMDVSNYSRWNHAIDLEAAWRITKRFGLHVPMGPLDVAMHTFPEFEPKEGEPESVDLKVLCFFVDKQKNQ